MENRFGTYRAKFEYENHIPSQGDDQIMTWDAIYEQQRVDVQFHAEYHAGRLDQR